MQTRLLGVIVAALSIFGFVQSASADDFYATNAAEIPIAINAANASLAAEEHVVHIAAGSYTITGATFPTMSPSAFRTRVVGAGPGQTTFNTTTNVANPNGIWLELASADSTLEGFTLNSTATTTYNYALWLQKGTIENFEINATVSGTPTQTALELRGGATARDGAVENLTGGSGVVAVAGNATAEDISVSGNAGVGVVSSGTNQSFSRMTIRGFILGFTIGNGSAALTDSTIDLGSRFAARGIEARDQQASFASNLNLTARRLTIVGTGDNQTALLARSEEAPDVVNASFRDIVSFNPTGFNFRGFSCENSTNGGLVEIDAIATNGTTGATGGCNFSLGTTIALTGSPFKDFATGDLRPHWNSSLIDAGGTTVGAIAKDVAGSTRVVDGDGSSTATVDIGAHEYQRSAPTVSVSASKSSLAVLEAVTFTADADDADGETLTYAWTIDGVAALTTDPTLGIGFLTPGAHAVAVTVTDEAGVQAIGSSTVQVGSSTPTTPITPTVPTCPTSTYPKVKLTTKPKKAFKIGKRGFKVSKKPKQPYFALKVSAAGNYGLKLLSIKGGTAGAYPGTQTVKLKKGTNKLTFGGKWNKKKLKKGSYQVQVVPVPQTACNANVVLATVKLKLK